MEEAMWQGPKNDLQGLRAVLADSQHENRGVSHTIARK